MRRLKGRMLKGSVAGLTLAALMGAGTVFGGAVFAADVQDDIVVEELSDKESGEAYQEPLSSEAGVDEALDSGESALTPSGAEKAPEESADAVEKDSPAEDELRQNSGVSAVQSSRDEGGNPSAAAQDNSADTEINANPEDDTEKNAEAEVEEEPPVKEGWILENGVYKYYKAGEAYTGWHYMGAGEGEKIPHWSYFAKDGSLYTGWHRMGSNEGEKTAHWSYFGDNGWLRTGWVQMGKGTGNPDGNAAKHWSYFGDNGWLRTGWVQMGKGTGNPDGNAAKHWSYFGDNGWLRTGWVQLGKGTGNPDGNTNKHWSYFGDNGWLRTGWVQLGKGTGNPDGNAEKHWSYFGDNGWLRTGWVQLGKGTSEPDGNAEKHWSYFGDNGWLRTGLQTMGTASNPDGGSKQHLSYFGGNGWLVVSKLFTEKNVQYIADSKGWATKVQTEHEKVMARAIQLVEQVTNSSMTKEQKLRACYIHIRDNYPEYNPRIPHFAGEGWHITYANDIFINKGGNCISVGAAFAYMAAAIGYENVYAVNGTGHGWAEVNGLVYDAEWERHHEGNYYAVNYNDTLGTQKYKWIFGSSNPYARIKLS